MERMKLIVAGSRCIDDYSLIKAKLDKLKDSITEIVSGTAYGVDRLGERWGIENNIPVKRYPANWSKFGKSAGYIRNRDMANYADGLIAFWDGKSSGTKNMIAVARYRKLVVEVILV